MTTTLTLTCRICGLGFAPEDSSRRGPKPTICPDCTARYRNPPEQETEGHCRMCQTHLALIQETDYPGDTLGFCPSCYQLHRKVYLRDAKQMQRTGK